MIIRLPLSNRFEGWLGLFLVILFSLPSASRAISKVVSLGRDATLNVFSSSQSMGGSTPARADAATARLEPQMTFPFIVDSTGDGSDPVPGDGICGTVLVTKNQSGGPCTLRAAIESANAIAGTDSILFNIPASDPNCSSGVCTITTTSKLPDLSTTMSITRSGRRAAHGPEPDYASPSHVQCDGIGREHIGPHH